MLKNVARLAHTQIRCVGIKNVTIKNSSADIFPEKGTDAAKGPVKVILEAGKEYSYCNCGFSARQPFCDGTHNIYGKTFIRPVKFSVDQTGEYIMCQCKQTGTRPLCDGSHKKISSVPKSAEASTFIAMGTYRSPVYEGVAKQLGYRSKKGFQQ